MLAAIALAIAWHNAHPECTVAAWLMSEVTAEADYVTAGALADALHRAKAAMGDPAYKEITTEYQKGVGAWATDRVLKLDTLHEEPGELDLEKNHAAVEQAVTQIPWLLLIPASDTWPGQCSQSFAQAEAF